jgi:FkbM family methyltransferase
MNSFVSSHLRRVLAFGPVLVVSERAAQEFGRRFPNASVVKKLEHEVSHALRNSGGNVRRLAKLPYGAKLVVPLGLGEGRDYYFYASDRLQGRWLYEAGTTRFLCRWLRPGDTFIDIGANLGYYTLLASAIIDQNGMCHAFEPNEQLAAWIRESIAINGADDRVLLNTVAVAEETGNLVLYVPTEPGCSNQASLVAGCYEGTVRDTLVPSISLDDYVSRHRIGSIRLVKVDVEGAETRVLAGATSVLRGAPPDAIIIEHAPILLSDATTQWSRVCTILSDAGYAPFSIASGGDLRPLDGSMPSQPCQNVCFTHVSSPSAL